MGREDVPVFRIAYALGGAVDRLLSRLSIVHSCSRQLCVEPIDIRRGRGISRSECRHGERGAIGPYETVLWLLRGEQL